MNQQEMNQWAVHTLNTLARGSIGLGAHRQHIAKMVKMVRNDPASSEDTVGMWEALETQLDRRLCKSIKPLESCES